MQVKLSYRRVDYYLQIFQMCASLSVHVCVCVIVGWQFACGYAQISLLSALCKAMQRADAVPAPVGQLPVPHLHVRVQNQNK